MMPRVVPRAIATWTWVLRRGSRIQNSTEGPKSGLRANGASSKNIWEPRLWSPSKIGQGSRRLVKVILPTKNPKNSYWVGSSTIPQLDQTWNIITLIKNYQNTCFPCFCWHLPEGKCLKIMNLLRLKRVDLVGESQSQWDMHEGEGSMCLGLFWS